MNSFNIIVINFYPQSSLETVSENNVSHFQLIKKSKNFEGENLGTYILIILRQLTNWNVHFQISKVVFISDLFTPPYN